MKPMKFYKDELYPVYYLDAESGEISLPKTLATKYEKAFVKFLNVKNLVDSYLAIKEKNANEGTECK